MLSQNVVMFRKHFPLVVCVTFVLFVLMHVNSIFRMRLHVRPYSRPFAAMNSTANASAWDSTANASAWDSTANASAWDSTANASTWLEQLQVGCGEICRHDTVGTPSLFFDHMRKRFDCRRLWENAAVDASMREPEPPAAIPTELMEGYTYGGRVPVVPFRQLFNQRYLGGEAFANVWTEAKVDEWAAQCGAGTLEGTYGADETKWLLEGLKRMSLANASVLVIGSEIPWVEACVLYAGARLVTTLEYGRIRSEHPRVVTVTPDEMRARFEEMSESFDAVVTFSSVEHAGLGRYGDAMNPWGDRQAIARGWCAAKPGARLLIAVMTGDDRIEYNAHRVYGPVMYPHLVANWEQLWRAPGGGQVVHVLLKNLTHVVKNKTSNM